MSHRECTASQRVAGPYLLKKSQQCRQFATHSGMFQYSTAVSITALAYGNSLLRITNHMKV